MIDGITFAGRACLSLLEHVPPVDSTSDIDPFLMLVDPVHGPVKVAADSDADPASTWFYFQVPLLLMIKSLFPSATQAELMKIATARVPSQATGVDKTAAELYPRLYLAVVGKPEQPQDVPMRDRRRQQLEDPVCGVSKVYRPPGKETTKFCTASADIIID